MASGKLSDVFGFSTSEKFAIFDHIDQSLKTIHSFFEEIEKFVFVGAQINKPIQVRLKLSNLLKTQNRLFLLDYSYKVPEICHEDLHPTESLSHVLGNLVK